MFEFIADYARVRARLDLTLPLAEGLDGCGVSDSDFHDAEQHMLTRLSDGLDAGAGEVVQGYLTAYAAAWEQTSGKPYQEHVDVTREGERLSAVEDAGHDEAPAASGPHILDTAVVEPTDLAQAVLPFGQLSTKAAASPRADAPSPHAASGETAMLSPSDIKSALGAFMTGGPAHEVGATAIVDDLSLDEPALPFGEAYAPASISPPSIEPNAHIGQTALAEPVEIAAIIAANAGPQWLNDNDNDEGTPSR